MKWFDRVFEWTILNFLKRFHFSFTLYLYVLVFLIWLLIWTKFMLTFWILLCLVFSFLLLLLLDLFLTTYRMNWLFLLRGNNFFLDLRVVLLNIFKGVRDIIIIAYWALTVIRRAFNELFSVSSFGRILSISLVNTRLLFTLRPLYFFFLIFFY